MSSSSASQYAQFTPKEREEISSLQHTIQSHESSKIEKQIAEAKLDNLRKSKEPAPHNHKHHLHLQGGGQNEDIESQSTKGGSNVFHNDEAFERFAMGSSGYGHEASGSGSGGSKVRNQAAAQTQSVKMNHKVRGTVKEKVEKEFESEDLHDHIRG